MVVCILLAGILAAPRSRTWGVPAELRRSAAAWAVFLAVACLSLLKTSNPLSVVREILDALLAPAILGWYIVRQFRLGANAKWLHVGICVISLYSVAIGIAEVATQQDLMAFGLNKGYYIVDPTDPTQFAFLRPNGPFMSVGSFSVVGLISLFLLSFLWPLIRENAHWGYRVLHFAGSAAALVQALLPMFRSVYLTLGVVMVLEALWSTGMRRMLHLAGIGLLLAVIVAISLFLPAIYEDRSNNKQDVNGRMSEDRQIWRIFIDHPVFGVGLNNFTATAESNPRYLADLGDQPPLNFAHNNLGWIAAETGLAGLIPFVASQGFLLFAFRRLARRGANGRTAWRYFVFIFLSYWIMGILESQAAFGELNVWFVFALALLYRYGYGTSEVAAPTQFSAAV